MEEFVLPEFLQETEDETHDVMIRMAPSDIDTSEGALYWDHTRPTAAVKARFVGYELTLTMMMMFPQFAEGIFLDWHGEPIGIYRRPATNAFGDVSFSGKAGVVIPAGTIVSTIGDENEAGYLYSVVNAGIIGESGQVTLRIKAMDLGAESNIPARTVRGLVDSIQGITSLINDEPIEGGTNEEDDDTYRIRIIEHHQNKPLSGSRSDYVKWAKEVPGVGDVIVLPLWNGPKTVKVLITDSDRQLASAELIALTQEHIAPDEDLGGGLAPIGAIVTVDTITTIPINITLSLIVAEDYLLSDVILNVKDSVNAYFSDKPLVKWAEVVAVIVKTEGVADHSGLLLNDATSNISLGIGERAIVGEVLVHE